MNLFELCDAVKNFNLLVDEETGEILDEENAKELDALQIAKDEKIENVALLIKNIEAEADAVKKQKDAFYSREKSLTNKAKWLRGYLASSLNGEKWKSDKVVLSWRKSESVDLDDDFSDERFIKYEPKISKTDIKDALKRGEEVAGARLIEKSNLQIK